MQIRVAKDSDEWNALVDRNPYSVLYHRYELCASDRNNLPLIINEAGHRFLFPLKTTKLFKTFTLVTTPVHYYTSLLPDPEALDLTPKVLDSVVLFLGKMGVDYLSTCAPTFLSRRFATLLTSWFRRHGATIQVFYAQMIQTGGKTFEEIWKRFRRRNREEIRKAEREGVEIVKIDDVEGINGWIDDIYLCNVSALLRQGRWGAYPDSYKDVYLSELIAWKKLLKEHFNIYGAVFRGRLIAYIIAQEYNKFMKPTKAYSQTNFLKKHPNDVLVTHLLKEACERGFEWFDYGFDRVRRDGKIPSPYPGIQRWRRKFGFVEIPIPIYRLGLTHSGKIMQYLYSSREYVIARSAFVPEPIRGFITKLYAPRRRKFSLIIYA